MPSHQLPRDELRDLIRRAEDEPFSPPPPWGVVRELARECKAWRDHEKTTEVFLREYRKEIDRLTALAGVRGTGVAAGN